MKTITSDIKSTWNKLPPYARLGITIVGGLFAFKKAKGLFNALKTSPQTAKADEDKFRKQGQKPSFPSASYTGWADIIYSEYFNDLWSSFSDVKYIFERLQNDLDVSKLIQAFGERRILFSTNTGDLQTILYRIDDDAPKEVNEIFAKKGIKYRF
jgi:hypothetical protein